MENNNEFDYRSGSVRTMIILDFITLASLVGYSIVVQRLYEASVAYLLVYVITSIVSWVAFAICLALRFKLLSSKKRTQAIVLQFVCGVCGGLLLEIVNGIIIVNSNLYPDPEESSSNTLEWYQNKIKEINDKHALHQMTDGDYTLKLNKYKANVKMIKEKLIVGLNNLRVKTITNGMTPEDQAEIDRINLNIDLCNQLLNEETKIYTLDDVLEKYNELDDEKKEIFDKYKGFFDEGVYTEDEFLRRVVDLF